MTTYRKLYSVLAFLIMFTGWTYSTYGQYHTISAGPFTGMQAAEPSEILDNSESDSLKAFNISNTKTIERLDIFFPNPLISNSQLNYRATEESKTKFFLFNEYGSIAIYLEGSCIKGINTCTISRKGLRKGLHYYILWIAKENRTIKGQLTVM